MKLLATIAFSLFLTGVFAVTKDEIERRGLQLLTKLEDAVKSLLLNPNSNEEDIESLRFEEDAVRTVLKEVQKPDISTRLLDLLITKLDDIQSETDQLLSRILGTTPAIILSTQTSPTPPPPTTATSAPPPTAAGTTATPPTCIPPSTVSISPPLN